MAGSRELPSAGREGTRAGWPSAPSCCLQMETACFAFKFYDLFMQLEAWALKPHALLDIYGSCVGAGGGRASSSQGAPGAQPQLRPLRIFPGWPSRLVPSPMPPGAPLWAVPHIERAGQTGATVQGAEGT